MSLPDYLNMDPNILYSIVNTKLRNEFEDLDALANAFDLEREALERRLKAGGFHYEPTLNQFRQDAR